jgi:4'-phosphopantetheinyl transferase
MVTQHELAPWRQGDAHPFLAQGELHIWLARLDVSEKEQAAYARLVAPDESARAERFHFEHDRRFFVAGRGILRILLGRYLACPPERLAFLYGLKGKPSLPGTVLEFNLAHSGGLAVFTVACGGAVGIDLERVRPVPDFDRIMNSFFAAAEIHAISALPAADQLRAFFTCWTRKEAYLKATGDGITVRLDRFSVPVVPGSPPSLLHVEGASEEARRWSFQELPLGPEYVGAVAFEGTMRAIQYCLWSGP